MSWLFRQKPDGRRAPGYAVYLAGGLAAAAGMLALRHFAVADGSARRRPARVRPSNISTVTQPAAIMAPVEVAAPPAPRGTRSFRLHPPLPAAHVPDPASAPGPADFDPIAVALDGGSGPAAAGRTEVPVAAWPELAPAFAEEPGRRGAAETVRSAAQLLGYRDASADAGAGGPDGATPPAGASGSAAFLPRGTLIAVYLLTTVDTGNPAAVLEFGAARSVCFRQRCQLPFGTRFLGRLAGHAGRDRLSLTAETLLFPDGGEFPVSASAVEADESGVSIRPGVGAYFHPPPSWVQVAPYFADFFSGAMGLLQSRAGQQWSVGVGGVSVQSSAGGDLRAPLYQASARAVEDFTQARLRELEQRYGSFYLVPAGTACWLQLDSDLKFHAPE